jgi:hypothetical protein
VKCYISFLFIREELGQHSLPPLSFYFVGFQAHRALTLKPCNIKHSE